MDKLKDNQFLKVFKLNENLFEYNGSLIGITDDLFIDSGLLFNINTKQIHDYDNYPFSDEVDVTYWRECFFVPKELAIHKNSYGEPLHIFDLSVIDELNLKYNEIEEITILFKECECMYQHEPDSCEQAIVTNINGLNYIIPIIIKKKNGK